MSGRREPERRVTPDLIRFHTINARHLRLEARGDICRLLQASFAKIILKLFRKH